MRALAVALAAIGALDLLLGLARGRWAAAGTVAAAAAVAGWGGWAVGLTPVGYALLAASVTLESPLWIAAGRRWRPRLTLVALATALAARVLTAGLWHPVAGSSVLDRWSGDLPYGPLLRIGPERVAYVAAALLFLATAANTLVRLLLSSVPGLTVDDGDERLPGGGRVIGSLERVLIFGLAVAGEATAAALVISAKGILRFAEVRAAPGGQVDRITEYVLVGSLASYTLAMAFVPLALP